MRVRPAPPSRLPLPETSAFRRPARSVGQCRLTTRHGGRPSMSAVDQPVMRRLARPRPAVVHLRGQPLPTRGPACPPLPHGGLSGLPEPFDLLPVRRAIPAELSATPVKATTAFIGASSAASCVCPGGGPADRDGCCLASLLPPTTVLEPRGANALPAILRARHAASETD